jgi:hypothetical protein
MQKDKEAEAEDNRRKNAARNHLISVKATLDKQVEEKQHKKVE